MSKHVFGTAGLTFQATNKGIVPALQSSKFGKKQIESIRLLIFSYVSAVAMQLNKSTMGSLVWRAGMASSMSCSLTRDTPSMHFVSMLQFGIPHSFGFIAYTHKLVDGKVRLGFRFVYKN
jgi:hypothetical protein